MNRHDLACVGVACVAAGIEIESFGRGCLGALASACVPDVNDQRGHGKLCGQAGGVIRNIRLRDRRYVLLVNRLREALLATARERAEIVFAEWRKCLSGSHLCSFSDGDTAACKPPSIRRISLGWSASSCRKNTRLADLGRVAPPEVALGEAWDNLPEGRLGPMSEWRTIRPKPAGHFCGSGAFYQVARLHRSPVYSRGSRLRWPNRSLST